MWPISAEAFAALQAPHTMSVRASSTTATQGTISDLPIHDGTIQVSSTQIVRRNCTLEINPALWPASVYDPLSPISSEITVDYGVLVRGGFEWIPVFTGPIQRAKRKFGTGLVTIEAAGREQRVVEDRMDAPAQTVAGATVVAEITRLIQESIPGATVIDTTGSSATAAQITIDLERWRDGVEVLANAIGAEVYADAAGRFIIRSQPVLSGAQSPVLIIAAGDEGTLVDGDEDLTREAVYNRVIVEGVRSDGTPPVRAVVSDTDTSSPTFYGGPFGRKPRRYVSPLLTTVGMCTTAGQALLARAKGMQSAIVLESVPHPGLEGGDIVQANLPDGRRQLHIVGAFNLPLKPGPVQRITSRSLELPPESGG